jgi:hypothetical protein
VGTKDSKDQETLARAQGELKYVTLQVADQRGTITDLTTALAEATATAAQATVNNMEQWRAQMEADTEEEEANEELVEEMRGIEKRYDEIHGGGLSVEEMIRRNKLTTPTEPDSE